MPIKREALLDAIHAALNIVDSRIIYYEEIQAIYETSDESTAVDFLNRLVPFLRELRLIFDDGFMGDSAIQEAKVYKKGIAEEVALYKTLKTKLQHLRNQIPKGVEESYLLVFVDQVRDFIFTEFYKKSVGLTDLLLSLERKRQGLNKERRALLRQACTQITNKISECSETAYYQRLSEIFYFKSEMQSKVEEYIKFIRVPGSAEEGSDIEIHVATKEMQEQVKTYKRDLCLLDRAGELPSTQHFLELLSKFNGQLRELSRSAACPMFMLGKSALLKVSLPRNILDIFATMVEIDKVFNDLNIEETSRITHLKEQQALIHKSIIDRDSLARDLFQSYKEGLTLLKRQFLGRRITILQEMERADEQRASLSEEETRERSEVERQANVEERDIVATYRAGLSKLMRGFNRTFPGALKLEPVQKSPPRQSPVEPRRPLSPTNMRILEQIYKFGMKKTNGVVPNISFESLIGLIELLGGRRQIGRCSGSHHKYQMPNISNIPGMELHILDPGEDDFPVARAAAAPEYSLPLVRAHRNSTRHLTFTICFRVFTQMGVFNLLDKAVLNEALTEPRTERPACM